MKSNPSGCTELHFQTTYKCGLNLIWKDWILCGFARQLKSDLGCLYERELT